MQPVFKALPGLLASARQGRLVFKALQVCRAQTGSPVWTALPARKVQLGRRGLKV